MYTKPLPRIIASVVVAMIAVAAFLTFTRGEAPAADTASATLPGVSSNAPVVGSSTPTPSSSPSADAAEREAESERTQTPTGSPTQGGPTTSPTTSAPDPEPTKEPPPPSPSPKPTCGLLSTLLGCR